MSDNVNHPSHYTKGGIECVEAIKASMTPDGFQDYCKGNVMKYIWRWRYKAGIEDLKKARVYLNWLIESTEKNKPKEVLVESTEKNKPKEVLVESTEKDKPKQAFVQFGRGNGKSLTLGYVKADLNRLDDYIREYYFHSLVEDLRICSSPMDCCFKCTRGLIENGCDMLESDAADAIEFLLKELKEKEDPKEEKKDVN